MVARNGCNNNALRAVTDSLASEVVLGSSRDVHGDHPAFYAQGGVPAVMRKGEYVAME